jgi:signal transduction histidine kinase/CheY-like chemotaxis protein/HPt (histidine-containing phosphotransfer) domain-containing protein
MDTQRPRTTWSWLTAAAVAAALVALGMVLLGNADAPWLAVAAGAGLLALAAALASVAATAAHARSYDDAASRAATAEYERNQLKRDVSRHDQLEQELLQAKQAAESAVLAKGEFLATMSHEIRTPLNGIIPMLDLMARSNLAADQRELLRTAHDSSLQLLRIVDDILDYSKLEANKLELEITSFNLRELLDGVRLLMQRPAEGKGLRLELEIDPNVRLPVRGDPVRLRQVLGNLIANAVKFTERGAIQLSVRRLGETTVQHQLRFEVRDTGIGIGPEQQARLFRAFSQADASTTRLYGGTGLGLAICKRIVDLMGGKIGVQSEPGRGSTFWFEVPLLKVVGDVQVRGESQEGARKVLVVSPDLRLRQRMSLLLPNWGLTVSIVETVQEALDRMRGPAGPGQGPAFATVLADHDGLRQSARALHRALLRTPTYSQVRLVWLYGEDSVDEDLRERASLLPRLAHDADLRGILLPVQARPADGGAGSAAPRAASSQPLLFTGPPPRLLLVEDNPVNLLVAQKLLSVLGLICETATNGEQALRQMHTGNYDLVMMDCQMPVLDGYTATRRWREHEAATSARRLPIVAMTANAMAGDRQRCMDAGMDDYLSKPVARDQLEACLRRWLQTTAVTTAAPPTPATPAAPSPAVPAASAAPTQPAAPTAEPVTALAAHGEEGLPVLDPSQLDELAEFAGQETQAIVRLFLEDAPRLVRQLEMASATPDLAAMREAAHALKSSSANVGALALSAVAKRIELGARANALERPAVAVALLIAEFARARIALQGWLSSQPSQAQSSSLLNR